MFGNVCTRIVAPAGRHHDRRGFHRSTIRARPTGRARGADRCRSRTCPAETLVYLLGSRYCDTDHLSNTAWSLFGHGPTGWARVQAICDYVHERLTFGYSMRR